MERQKVKLKDITCQITDGKHGDCMNQESSGFYFISCKDVSNGCINYENARQITRKDFDETDKRTNLQPNDIVITNSGTIGRMALVKDAPITRRTTFQKSVAIIKPNNQKVLPIYLYYVLQDNIKFLINNSVGSAQKNLLLSTMRDFVLEIHPSISIQHRIASILSAYDNLIENNNRRIRLLEQMAENLYKEWFVRFRFPGHEKAEFENGLPKGWKVEKVQDWCRVFTGKKDVNQTVADGKYAFFSCSPDMFKSNDYIYDGKAILVAGNGSYTGRTRYFEGKFDLYQRTYAIVSKKDESEFLYYLYTRFKFDFEKIYSGGTRGSAIPYIVMKDLTRYKFFYEETIVKKYVSIIRPMFQQMDILKEECLFLSRQRDLLLPRLMSGKLEVKV